MTALLLRGSRPSLWQLQRLPAACIHSRISGRGHLAARTCADGATTGLTSTSVARAGHLQARDERSVASLITGNVDTTLRSLETMLGPMDPSHTVPPPKPVVVVVSGPSGVGKDTVVARLKEQREDLYFVVTATSRPKRSSEVEGRDYFFVTREKFEEWIAQDMLLEHALVYGDYKGIPRQQVDDALRAGTDVVLRIDVQGAATVKRLIPDAITIFVAAEDEPTLVKRLVERKTETVDKLAVRVATARSEMESVKEFDYVVINKSRALEQCVAQVSGIIDAEKARVKRRYGLEPHSTANTSSSSQ